MSRVAVQRVEVLSAFKFGFILGALFTIIPDVLLAIVGKWIVSTIRAVLESWQNVVVDTLLGQTIRINLITQLKLEELLRWAQNWDAYSPLILFLLVLLGIVLGGLASGTVAGLAVGLYNLTAALSGGIRIDIEDGGITEAPSPAPPGAHDSGPWLVGATIPTGRYALVNSPTRIGRDSSNHLVLASTHVAPFHADLVLLNGRWIVRNLSDSHSTLVNGRPIRENMLKDGFQIRFGDVQLTFRSN